MRLRSVVVLVVVVISICALGAYVWSWRSASEPVSAETVPDAEIQTVRQGFNLATIGNCATCHTAPSGEPFSGGLAIPTPFGTIFSTNITPDAGTGIGNWSEAAFRRALREGVDRAGRHLYPAFPYNHFTHATNEDIHALYAFLMSQPAIDRAAPENELMFPLGFRPLLAGWKLLFLDEGTLRPVSNKGAEWNRGRYLVKALGHCGACHTPRNILGAEKESKTFAGAKVKGWYAPALNTGEWTAAELTEFLSTGWQQSHGAAMGPMAEVVDNLRQVPESDVRAIAVYVASFSPRSEPASPAAQPSPPADAPAEVIAIYEGVCATCHNAGAVGPSRALPLTRSTALQLPGPANAVQIVLNGIDAYRDTGGPYMPAFSGILTDRQIASIVNYARASYTDKPAWDDVQEEVRKASQGAVQ